MNMCLVLYRFGLNRNLMNAIIQYTIYSILYIINIINVGCIVTIHLLFVFFSFLFTKTTNDILRFPCFIGQRLFYFHQHYSKRDVSKNAKKVLDSDS